MATEHAYQDDDERGVTPYAPAHVPFTPVTADRWRAISAALREPFPPEMVDFRAQGRVSETTGKGQVVCYVDARAVQDRLDTVVGAGNWSFDWTPVVVEKGDVQIAKGTLTIYGVAKSDAGSASNFEATLGAVSHCFKRAGVQWGIARYLYDVESQWVPVEKNGRIAPETIRQLRARLPKPASAPASAPAVDAVADDDDSPELTFSLPEATPDPTQAQQAQAVTPATNKTRLRAVVATNPPTTDQIVALAKAAKALSIDPATLNPQTATEAFALLTDLRAQYTARNAAKPETAVQQRVADLHGLPVGQRGN